MEPESSCKDYVSLTHEPQSKGTINLNAGPAKNWPDTCIVSVGGQEMPSIRAELEQIVGSRGQER
jgi:hypothetical protein